MLLQFVFALLVSSVIFGEVSATCQWRSQKQFSVVKAILENQIDQNDTLLWELAGIFSNQQKPLKQVVAHYKIIIPSIPEEESCDDYPPKCELAYKSNSFNCPENYSCIALDYVWGRYPITAQDNVFRDLDVCPLVIGDYEQREIDIYFTLKNPPSCDSSFVDEIAIEEEIFPCGWQCAGLRTRLPENGYSDQPIFMSVNKETPLEIALTGITAKLLAYGTVKEDISPLGYDIKDVIGYSARLPTSTYFNPLVEYGAFLSSYILMHIVIFMVICKYKDKFYDFVYEYVTKDKIQFCLFWSFIFTFFITFCNITIIFAAEGGICITLLQLYLLCISLFPGLLYVVMVTIRIKRRNGFFKAFENLNCVKIPFFDQLIQILVFIFLFTFPHVSALVVFLSSVSFFDDPSSTSFLLLYLSSSSVVLWIVNAIFLYLVSPSLLVCCCPTKCSNCMEVFFAICLALSVNLMNISVMSFIGDYFYDRRIEGTSIFAVIPVAITLLGWHKSDKAVEKFATWMSDDNEEATPTQNGMFISEVFGMMQRLLFGFTGQQGDTEKKTRDQDISLTEVQLSRNSTSM